MNIRGSHTMEAPRAVVFAAICDPDALLGIIPGCREIEQVGDAEYRGQISLRLPGVVGTYRTVVRLVDSDPPSYGRLEGELEGTLGTVTGHATFRLAESDGTTTIEYEGQGVVGGPLARLDARFAEGLAGSLIKQGLRNLGSRLKADPAAGTPSDRRQPTREIPA
jgi:carbon monoxide dehydrogenase subunit G